VNFLQNNQKKEGEGEGEAEVKENTSAIWQFNIV
jgi:hypothetical protein